MNYRLIIGLEVHVQLLTQTKLFCGCSTQFGLPANSATCPICIGMPGTMPVMNEHAFRLALKAALALNCEIAPFTKWDRKNYFYPDLPKNYQISQYDLPFSREGWLDIPTEAGRKKIGIFRAHLEEDAGKMLHDEQGVGRDSLVDLNRTGTPLLEIVSKPEMETPQEAKAYLEEIRLLLREIEISDCEMQEGSLRCDANINLHIPLPEGGFAATPIIEVKNLNSFRNVEKALEYEANRQYEEYQEKQGKSWETDRSDPKSFGNYQTYLVKERRASGFHPVSKATAGWNDRLGRTEVQRRKEEASDYRYFPEPDLVPVKVDSRTLYQVRQDVGELPAIQKARMQSHYQLSEYDADVLSRQGRAMVGLFEGIVKAGADAKEACNWLTNEVLQTLNEKKLSPKEFPIPAGKLGEMICVVKSKGLPKQRAREVYTEMLATGEGVELVLKKLGFDRVVVDENQLREIVRKAIAGNAKAVADFQKGKIKAADAIKGAVMRDTKGMANTELVQKLVMEELKSINP